jgi:hypothetical protein
MPAGAFAHFHNYGPATAAMVADPGVGSLHFAEPHKNIRAGVNVVGSGTVGVMRPYRCRNAAINVLGEGALQMAPKRWVRTGLTVSVNALSASDVEGALQNMRVEGSLTFVQAMRAILAMAANNATGLDGPTAVFKSRDGSKNRIEATLSGGNRTVSTLDLD